MAAILAALMMAQTEFHPLDNCALVRPVAFFEDINALPIEIRSDIEKRYGNIYPRTEKNLNFSDMPRPNTKWGAQLIYVAHATNQWLISYIYGGAAIQTVTVSYIQTETGTDRTPYLMGGLQGGGCAAANAFLSGVSVEPGWQR